MGFLDLIQTIVIGGNIITSAVNPIVLFDFFGNDIVSYTSDVTGLNIMEEVSLSPFRAITDSIGGLSLNLAIMINDIFTFTLMNVVTPILLIAFLVLFVLGQYYLIRFYYLIARFIIHKVLVLSDFIVNSQKLRELTLKAKQIIE